MKYLELKNDKIKSIELFDIRIPLVHPFTTSFGTETVKTGVLVRIEDSQGYVGWGESSVMADPGYSPETTETVWYILTEFLIPLFKTQIKMGKTNIPEMLGEWEKIRGHEFAKAGLESSLWALLSEQLGVSLGEIYGATKERIPTGVSIGIQKSLDELISRIEMFLSQGYKRIKIKIRPGWDVVPVQKIREEFGDILLMVDANSAYSLSEQHLEALKKLDDYNLMMIEQPLRHDDILAHCKLQKILNTPICLDESIHSVEQADLSLEMGCCKIINIKPGRVGGYYNSFLIASHNSGKVWLGGMLESGIGRMHNIFIQAREEFKIPGDTSGSDRYFKKDIIEPPVTVDETGYIEVPRSPGLGIEVLEDVIKQHSLKHEKIIF